MTCRSSLRSHIFRGALFLAALVTGAAGQGAPTAAAATDAPLVNHVPAGVMFYMGWDGSPAHWPGYKQSTLAAFLKRSALAPFLSRDLPKLLKTAAGTQPMLAGSKGQISGDLAMLARHPWVFYCTPADAAGGPVGAGLIIHAGGDAAKVMAKLRQLSARLPARAQARAGNSGGYCYLFSHATPAMLRAVTGDGALLPADKAFASAMAQLPAADGYAVYADLKKLESAENALAKSHAAAVYWHKVSTVYSLDSYRTFAEGGGLHGKRWLDGAFLAMRQPVVSHGGGVNSLLAKAPANSTSAAVVHFPLPRLYGFTMATAALLGKRAVVKQMLSQVASMTGISLRKDVLASFGAHWLFYTPGQAPNAVLGFVMVNRLKHPTRLANAIVIAAPLALMGINAQLEQHRVRHAAAVMKQMTVGSVTIYYIKSPKSTITPAWALDNGLFYFSLNPSLIRQAIDHPGKPVTASPGFNRAMAQLRLPTQALEAVGYEDQAALLPQGYNMVTQALAMANLYLHPAKPLANPLPPLQQVRPLMQPLASASWVDSAGWHLRQISSFPGAGLLSPVGWGAAPAMVNPATGLLIELGAAGGVAGYTVHVKTEPAAAPVTQSGAAQ